MNRMKKAVSATMALLLVMTAFVLPASVKAAGYAYVYVSSNTVYVGDSVTFTVGTVNAAGEISVSGAVSDHDWFDRSSKSYTVNAVTPGTITVSISGTIADYDTAQDMQIYESASVTVIDRPAVLCRNSHRRRHRPRNRCFPQMRHCLHCRSLPVHWIQNSARM